jgi:hypothetical protein
VNVDQALGVVRQQMVDGERRLRLYRCADGEWVVYVTTRPRGSGSVVIREPVEERSPAANP